MRDKPLLNRNINSITLYAFIIPFSLFNCVSLFCLKYKTSKKKLLGVHDVCGQIPKSIHQMLCHLPSDFPNKISKVCSYKE